jgi:large subunit ribosomal protein L28
MPKRKINHETRRALAPRPGTGNNVSFSQRKTRRVFRPNLQWALVEVDGKVIRARVSAKQIKTMCKAQK